MTYPLVAKTFSGATSGSNTRHPFNQTPAPSLQRPLQCAQPRHEIPCQVSAAVLLHSYGSKGQGPSALPVCITLVGRSISNLHVLSVLAAGQRDRDGTPPRYICDDSRPHRLKAAAPKFYAVPHNRVAEEGETVRFQCAIQRPGFRGTRTAS